MKDPTSYTPLESLFLFQSILTHGLDADAFVRISELLRGNALIRSDKQYDAARLAPDALQQLFLRLLREDGQPGRECANGDGGHEHKNDTDGSTSPSSRKRKLGSPPLLTLTDATAHVEKLPVLVEQLYSRYREHVVSQVREDEARLQVLAKEISVLERNERERLARLAAQRSKVGPPSPDTKTLAAAKASTSTPPPLQAGRRPTTSNTPVVPPKPPTTVPKAMLPTNAPPSHLPAGTSPAGPPSSPKPASGTKPILQAQLGAEQPASRDTPPSVQPPPLSIPPRPEASAKSQEASAAAQAHPAGGLKWEKPYQPNQTVQATLAKQQNVALSATQQTSSQQQQQQQQQKQLQKQQETQYHVPASQSGTPKPRPVPPQSTGQLATPPLQPAPPRAAGAAAASLPRHQAATPVPPPGRPVLPQPQAQLAHQGPRPIAAASPAPLAGTTTSTIPRSKAPHGQPLQQDRSSPSGPPVPQTSKPYSSPYAGQPLRPAIPERMIRQAAGTPAAIRRAAAISPTPQTPVSISLPTARGSATKWVSHSTPSTPGPLMMEPESPAYEPTSPPLQPDSARQATPLSAAKSPAAPSVPKVGAAVPKSGRGRPPRATKKGGDHTPFSGHVTRRSQSVASHTDELSMDISSIATKVKNEVSTPRITEDAGDTTADESVAGRSHVVTPSSISSRFLKRKRLESPAAEPIHPVNQINWTRGFTKVSSSILDQISGHRDANMFATALRERDAPGYKQIVLRPQDLTSIRAAIKHGNKAAIQAASILPGGDPGTPSVWLPISEDLAPPKGIVNSAQLERELVHMFCNAIMYNPDPDRGIGQAFLKRSHQEEEEAFGYHFEENGVVKNTRAMFVQVGKLMSNLRNAERDRTVPLPSATRPGSAATPADDTAEDEDELAADGDPTPGGVKRRRTATRG